MSDYMNVKTDFGAVGDGTTDDSAAFNNAFSSCSASGKKLYIPHSTYNMATTSLTSPGGFQIDTDYGATLIWGASFNGTGLTITGANQRIRGGLQFLIPYRSTIPSSSLIGIDTQKHYSQFEDVIVGSYGAGAYAGWYTGAQYAEWTHALERCNISGQVYGIYSTANAISIHKTIVSASEHDAVSGSGIYIRLGSGVSIVGCDIEGPSSSNICIANPNTSTGYSSGVDISGCYMEDANWSSIIVAGYPTSANKNRGVSIQGNLIYAGGAGTSYGVWAEYTDGFVVRANEINGHTVDSIYAPAAHVLHADFTGNYTDKPIST